MDLAVIMGEWGGDLTVSANDIGLDDTLETAVFVSLFTDARAPIDAELPGGDSDRRGWWGDVAPDAEGDQIGSLLWLLAREKQTAAVVSRAQQYASEALAWLIEDRIAERVEVEAEIVSHGVLGIAARIYRPSGDTIQYRFNYAWEAQAARARSTEGPQFDPIVPPPTPDPEPEPEVFVVVGSEPPPFFLAGQTFTINALPAEQFTIPGSEPPPFALAPQSVSIGTESEEQFIIPGSEPPAFGLAAQSATVSTQ